MGFFKIRGSLSVGSGSSGGSVNINPDVNIYRGAANRLVTDDAFQVGGTANLTGTVRAGGILTAAAGVNAAAGTVFAAPYATASPTIDTNGHIGFLQKGDRSYLVFQAGGTPFAIMFPQTSHGTVTVTVGGTP